jgi:hypothetical protein
MAASTGSASLSCPGSGLATGRSMHANNAGLSMPTKYGIYCVRSNYGFTSSFLLSWMVSWARFSMLSYTLAICLPTCAHAAWLPGTGCMFAVWDLASWTWKYCEPCSWINSCWYNTAPNPLSRRSCILFLDTRPGRPLLPAVDYSWTCC